MIARADTLAQRPSPAPSDASVTASATAPSPAATSFLDAFSRSNDEAAMTAMLRNGVLLEEPALSSDAPTGAVDSMADDGMPTGALADTLTAMAMPLIVPQFMSAPVALQADTDALLAGSDPDELALGDEPAALGTSPTGTSPTSTISPALQLAVPPAPGSPVPPAAVALAPPPVVLAPPPVALAVPPRPEAALPLGSAAAGDAEPSRSRVRVPGDASAFAHLAPASTRRPAEALSPAIASIADAPGGGFVAQAGTSANASTSGAQASGPTAAPSSQEADALRAALGERLQVQLARGQERAVIRLDPPMMGTVEIVIRHEGGALQVHVSATHSEVARQLQQMGDQLRQELISRQYGEVTVQVSDRSTDPDGRQRQSRDRSAEMASPGRALHDTTDTGDAPLRFSLFSDAEYA